MTSVAIDAAANAWVNANATSWSSPRRANQRVARQPVPVGRENATAEAGRIGREAPACRIGGPFRLGTLRRQKAARVFARHFAVTRSHLAISELAVAQGRAARQPARLDEPAPAGDGNIDALPSSFAVVRVLLPVAPAHRPEDIRARERAFGTGGGVIGTTRSILVATVFVRRAERLARSARLWASRRPPSAGDSSRAPRADRCGSEGRTARVAGRVRAARALDTEHRPRAAARSEHAQNDKEPSLPCLRTTDTFTITGIEGSLPSCSGAHCCFRPPGPMTEACYLGGGRSGAAREWKTGAFAITHSAA
jgi:hypothetical protein